jgi:hypothetical protein
MPPKNKLSIETKAITSGEYFPQTNNAMVRTKMVSIKYMIIFLIEISQSRLIIFYPVNL